MFQLFFANVAYADELDKFLGKVTDAILDPVIKLLFAVAFIMFFWGVVEFLMKANSEGNQEDGKRHMLWGIIGLVIMFSVWGLLNIVQSSLNSAGLDTTGINPEEGTVELKDYNPSLPPLSDGN